MSVATALSPAELLGLPLDALLAAAGASVIESSIDEEIFVGAVYLSPAGISLHLPKGRSVEELDAIARLLLGEALGVPLAPLPDGLTMQKTRF